VGKARERSEAAERRAQELEAQLQGRNTPQTPNQPSEAQVKTYIDQLQDKYEELLIDGEKEEARTIRQQLEQARDFLAEMKITRAAEATREGTLGTLKYETTLARIEADHPVLNPDSQEFDVEVATEVAEMAKAFMATGANSVQALTRAVKYVLPTKAAPATETAQNRAVEARRKVAAAAGRQPPNTAQSGKNSISPNGIDIRRVSQDAFAKIDDRTLSKLRGDEL